MKIVKATVDEIVFHIPEGYPNIETWLEKCGRTCYKSEDKITEDSAPKFVRMLHKRGHHAMLEHAMASARIIGDRGLSHELVRHRIASFAQESTRYCNYSKGKFSGEITVIEQPGIETDEQKKIWGWAMRQAEGRYLQLIEAGVKPQAARSVLPIGMKAEIVVSANLREWMHIFNMRCAKAAHPIIRNCALEILRAFNERLPCMYESQFEKFLSDGKNVRDAEFKVHSSDRSIYQSALGLSIEKLLTGTTVAIYLPEEVSDKFDEYLNINDELIVETVVPLGNGRSRKQILSKVHPIDWDYDRDALICSVGHIGKWHEVK